MGAQTLWGLKSCGHKILLKWCVMTCWNSSLDYLLHKLKPFILSYLKNGDQLLEDVLPWYIPSWTYLVVTYATTIYNSIDTDHAITVITWWLKDFHSRELLPKGFPLDAFISAMVTITKK